MFSRRVLEARSLLQLERSCDRTDCLHGSRRAPSQTSITAYAAPATVGSVDCLAGARAIRAAPMTTSTAESISSPRAMKFRTAWSDITAACAKLDHAVNAIRLRWLRRITGCLQQEDAERNIETHHHHRQRRVLLHH